MFCDISFFVFSFRYCRICLMLSLAFQLFINIIKLPLWEDKFCLKNKSSDIKINLKKYLKVHTRTYLSKHPWLIVFYAPNYSRL